MTQTNRESIDQYDLVEIVRVPEGQEGLIHVGDVGMVVNKYDEQSFEVECINPGDSPRWTGRINVRDVRLKSKDPYNNWMNKLFNGPSMIKRSVLRGAGIGMVFGALIGAGFGAITGTLEGILVGLTLGLVLGIVTGILTALLTVKTAGTTGGVSMGAYTGMAFGAVFGTIIGALVPTSVRMSANTQGLPVLDALAMGRFETAILTSFLLSILGTMVGAWVGGKNLVPRNLKK